MKAPLGAESLSTTVWAFGAETLLRPGYCQETTAFGLLSRFSEYTTSADVMGVPLQNFALGLILKVNVRPPLEIDHDFAMYGWNPLPLGDALISVPSTCWAAHSESFSLMFAG